MSMKAGSGGLNRKHVDAYGNPITTKKNGGTRNATKSRKKRSK